MSHVLQPGQEVVLTTGVRGVLYARTQPMRKRFEPNVPATWYFLPDVCAAVGLVVMNQPREVAETDIAEVGPLHPGRWPSAQHRLSAAERQAVYVAHMSRRPLPEQS